MKEGYKKTELGWIPEEWKIENLDSISSLIDGDRSSNYPSPNEIVDDGIIFFSTSNIKKNKLVYKECKYITQDKFDSLKKGKLKDGDLIITLRGSIGNVAKFNVYDYDTGFINAQMLIIRCEKIDSSFLWCYLTSQKCQSAINTISSGSAQPQLTKKDLSSLKIVVPLLKEQEKIAEILSSVDFQIDNTDKLIEKTKKLKKGLMQRLLTKGIGHKEFKMTEIGEIPVEWDIKEIGFCSDVTKLAGFEFTEYITYIEDGEIIALRALNLKNGKLDLTDIKTIDRKISDNLLRSKLFIGDVLFSYVGTIGEIALIEENDKYHLAPNVAKITFKEEVHPKYAIQYLMSNKLRNEIKRYITTTSQPALSMENIRKMKFAIPSIEEQNQIANILSSVDTQIEEHENKKAKLEELKKALMQQLLTGEIRVKI